MLGEVKRWRDFSVQREVCPAFSPSFRTGLSTFRWGKRVEVICSALQWWPSCRTPSKTRNYYSVKALQNSIETPVSIIICVLYIRCYLPALNVGRPSSPIKGVHRPLRMFSPFHTQVFSHMAKGYLCRSGLVRPQVLQSLRVKTQTQFYNNSPMWSRTVDPLYTLRCLNKPH